jgi:hypothetical protein
MPTATRKVARAIVARQATKMPMGLPSQSAAPPAPAMCRIGLMNELMHKAA